MLKVKQFRYSADNLGYLIYGTEGGMAVDGGAADGILAFLGEHRITLKYVANTHDHQDHTVGNEALLAATNARLLSGADLPDGGQIALDGGKIRIIHTPGHTEESRSFYTGTSLLAGDTLFNGTIGNCFSGDLEMARRAIDLGYYISFAGNVTFKNALHLQEIARVVPLERIIIETDSPYLSPQRGKRNEPAFVIETANVLAEARGVSFDEIARQTTENFFRLFAKVPRPAAAAA